MSYRFRPFNGERDWQWVKARVNVLRVEDTRGIMVEDDTGRLVAAAMFDNFLYSSVQMTLVMDSPLVIRAGLFDMAYRFVFDECGRDYCYAMVAENNHRSLRLCERVGFTEKMRIPNGYLAGVDLLVLELTRDGYYNAERLQRAA